MEPLIKNPNAGMIGLSRDPDEAETTAKAPALHVHRLAQITDHDAALDALTQHLETKVVEIDAKIMEGGKVVHYRNLREFARSPTVRKRIREGVAFGKLKGVADRLKESNFYQGLYPDEVSSSNVYFGLQDTVVPSINSPYAKQQTFHDYMTAHVRCWEAATRNPLGKRIVKLVPQFVLSRGLTCHIAEVEHQEAWNDFWKRHDMSIRIKTWLRELLIYGEQFNRHFRVGGKLVQRQVDPCTIWDVVTDPEDLEDVKYYYQQYIATSPIIVPGERMPPSTLVIRHIPADQVDHFTINRTSSEKRGRSELYAVLGWLLRFKEFMNDRVLQNKMRSMFALDVSVEGGAPEVAAANEQFATPPGPGAVAVHNKAIQIEYKNASTDAMDAQTDAAMILKVIAIGAGVSEQFLGVSNSSTRAGALLQTEPDVKNFEDYQQLVELMLQKTYERMVQMEGLPKTKHMFEVSFPALASEDRSVKLKDLALMEAQSWISKERSATMAAREIGVTTYDYDKEQEAIKDERAQDPVVMQGFQSVPKIGEDPMAPSAGAMNAKNDDGRKVVSTSGQMGYSAKALSGRNPANTSATLDRGGFTRSGEKASVKGRKSAGAPLRASAGPLGWNMAARAASLRTRRQRKLERLLQESAAVVPDSPRALKLSSAIEALRQVLNAPDTSAE